MLDLTRALRRTTYLAITAVTLFFACKKEFNELGFAERIADFAFPLFSTELAIQDLVANIVKKDVEGDTLIIHPDGTMTLFYTGNLAEKPASDLNIWIENALIPIAEPDYYAPIDAPNGVIIREVDLKSGQLTLLIVNTTPAPITGTFSSPQMTKNGIPLSIPFNAPANGLFFSPPVNLADWKLTVDNNTLYCRYEAFQNGQPIVIPEASPGTPGIGMSISGMNFSYMEGYWGYTEYPLTLDTIDIDINQTNLDGNVFIKNPRVTLTISNSWGFPTRGVANVFEFIGKDGVTYPLTTSMFGPDKGVDFEYPQWIKGEVGQTKITRITLDESNSNIAEIFNAQPVKLIYDVQGVANALQDPSIIGFLTDSSTIKLQVRVELFLEGSARNFSAEQDLNLNFGDIGNVAIEDLESVEFKLVTENSAPISTALQIYFQDSLGVVIDSLFESAAAFVMTSAPVNSEGVSTGSSRKETFIPMDRQRFERVRNASKAKLITYFTTAQDGMVPVKLLADNSARVGMGIRVRVKRE